MRSTSKQRSTIGSGRHFRDYHLLLDEQVEQVLAITDPLAERGQKIGGSIIRSVAHIAQLRRAKDNDEDFVAPKDMMLDSVTDNEKMVKYRRDTH